MYAEPHTVGHAAGIHHGTLSALATHFPEGMIAINGLDPALPDNADELLRAGRPGSQIDVAAETGDSQGDRDAAHVVRGLIELGKNPWMVPGAEAQPRLPIERYNQAANALREKVLGLPAEGHEKSASSAVVSVDMTVTSKWQVVALGELQQPGGVGATQEYNPVVDGPNPNGPNFGDNAGNSPEQEVALQTWVNTAIDLLNRGEQQESIIAQLAHDGCPNPQDVLQRAMEQPEHSPITDEIGQDPFKAPPTPDPSTSGQMESLSQQPPVQAKYQEDAEQQEHDRQLKRDEEDKRSGSPSTGEGGRWVEDDEDEENKTGRVRIAGTTMTGVEMDRWEDMWGHGTVKVALDGGGTIDVAPDAVQPIDGEAYKHPVSEIQQFIDSMPKVEPTRPHIEARLANLELVRRAVRSNISKVGFSDQQKLHEMDNNAAGETAALNEILDNFHEGFEIAYAKASRHYEVNAFHLGGAEVQPWAGRPKEAGAIWAIENFDDAITDNTSFTAAAAHYATTLGMTGTQFKEFLSGAEEHRHVRTDEFTAEEPETDNDGPAEALFVR